MEFNAAAERLDVEAFTGMREAAGVRTDFRVDRWDAEQTAWTARKMARDFGGPHPGGGIPSPVFAYYGVRPHLTTVEENCNLVVLGGWAMILGAIAGTSPTNKFSATFGRIGVGTSSTAVAAGDTFLTGDTGAASTTSYYQLVSGAPVIATGSSPATLTFSASFGNTVANFAWNEFGTDNWNASGVTAQGLGVNEIFFNHGLSAQGTKASGQTWNATETISFGYPSGAGTLS